MTPDRDLRVALEVEQPGLLRRAPGPRAGVLPQALAGGVYASLRPGLHWQKAAIWLLLDLRIDDKGQVHGPA